MGSTSAWGAIFILVATGIGSGVLVLPKLLAAVGYIPFFVILFVASIISGTTTFFLFRATSLRLQSTSLPLSTDPQTQQREVELRQTQQREADLNQIADLGFARMVTPMLEGFSYGELLVESTATCFGPFLDIVQVLYGLVGAVVTYFLFAYIFLKGVPNWPAWLDEPRTIVLFAAVVFPLTLPRSVAYLAKISSLTLGALFLLTFGILVEIPRSPGTAAHVVPALTDHATRNFPAVTCLLVFALFWHVSCVGVARELADPTPLRCAIVSFVAVSLLSTFYAVIAVGGYLSFGTRLEDHDDITAMYPDDDWLFVIIRLLLAFSFVIATVLNVYPTRESCAVLLRHAGLVSFVHPTELSLAVRTGISLVIVVVAAAVAILFPHVDEVMSLVGGTLISLLMVIFPTLMARRILPASYGVLFIFLLFFALFAIVSALVPDWRKLHRLDDA